MPSHNSSAFGTPWIDPNIGGFAEPRHREYEPEVGYGDWITCVECGKTRVQRVGLTCGICRSFILRPMASEGEMRHFARLSDEMGGAR